MAGLGMYLWIGTMLGFAGFGVWRALPDPEVEVGVERIALDTSPIRPDDMCTQVLITPEPRKPFNLLLIGSDRREDNGGVTGQRADTIMLARVDPEGGEARMVSFPRDLWVRIATTGQLDRLNAAYGKGPTTLVQTIVQNFGVTVNHYVEIDFAGLVRLVDALGGIEIELEHPVRDATVGLDLPSVGTQLLDGETALAYARSRHLEAFVEGAWELDRSADLGRIRRQQEMVAVLASRALAEVQSRPDGLDQLLRSVSGHLRIDESVPIDVVSGLIDAFATTDPSSVPTDIVPSDPGRTEGKSVLFVRWSEAAEVLEPYRGATGDLLAGSTTDTAQIACEP